MFFIILAFDKTGFVNTLYTFCLYYFMILIVKNKTFCDLECMSLIIDDLDIHGSFQFNIGCRIEVQG